MSTCPNGHPNPKHWEFCNECGEPIDDAENFWLSAVWQRSRRNVLLAGGGAVVAVVLVAAGTAVLITRNNEQTSAQDGQASAEAVAEWWTDSHEDVSNLRAALHDSEQALRLQDNDGLQLACQQLHDTAGVRVPAHLPTPDPELTSELQAAAQDAHDAAHMCLAAVAGSMNSYGGEFDADMDQADRHLAAAQEIIDRSVTTNASASAQR